MSRRLNRADQDLDGVAVEITEPPDEPGVGDRQSREARQTFQKAFVGLCKAGWFFFIQHLQDSDEVSPGQHWHAQGGSGLKSRSLVLLPCEPRVLGHVVDQNRFPLIGHPAGDAFADLHAGLGDHAPFSPVATLK